MQPAFVLKDYWVTRVLRALTHLASSKGHVIFKGGTSLSKGWNLIDQYAAEKDYYFWEQPPFNDLLATLNRVKSSISRKA